MPDLADFVTAKEAARDLGLHVETVRLFLRFKQLEGMKVGHSWLVAKASIAAYLEKNRGKARHAPDREH